MTSHMRHIYDDPYATYLWRAICDIFMTRIRVRDTCSTIPRRIPVSRSGSHRRFWQKKIRATRVHFDSQSEHRNLHSKTVNCPYPRLMANLEWSINCIQSGLVHTIEKVSDAISARKLEIAIFCGYPPPLVKFCRCPNTHGIRGGRAPSPRQSRAGV